MRSETSKVAEIHGMIPFSKMTDFESIITRTTRGCGTDRLPERGAGALIPSRDGKTKLVLALVGESFSAMINPNNQFIRKQLQVLGAWYFPLSEFEQTGFSKGFSHAFFQSYRGCPS